MNEMMKKNETHYVFAVDNTLVFTDELNTEAYVWALEQKGLSLDWKGGRITKEVIQSEFPNLPEQDMLEIRRMKRKYFLEHLDVTELNEELKDLILQVGPERCAYWFSANAVRVNGMLKHYGLLEALGAIISDRKKEEIGQAASLVKQFFCAPENVVFFESDPVVIAALREQGMEVVEVKRK